jgi:hypothetical protein
VEEDVLLDALKRRRNGQDTEAKTAAAATKAGAIHVATFEVA